MWLLTVFGEITSCCAIARSSRPRASSRSTSISRAVSPAVAPTRADLDDPPRRDGLDRIAVERAGADFGAQLGGRLAPASARAVRPRLVIAW